MRPRLLSGSIPGEPKRLAAVAILLTVMLFGGVLAWVSLRLRAELRRQIAGRDGQVLTQVALLQGLDAAEEVPVDPDTGEPMGLGDSEVDAVMQAERLKEVVSRMQGLLAARLYGVDGSLVLALPGTVLAEPLGPADLESLKRFDPVSRFRADLRAEELFAPLAAEAAVTGESLPVLEVAIPLRAPGQRRLIGIVQLVLDGRNIAAEFAALDRHLARQAGGIFVVGSAILATGLGWAFRRLYRINRLLGERTQSLLRANEELAMAARTSAVGAVTAHLIHGLKNPLAGLQQFVRGRGETPQANGDEIWTEAVQSTQRVQEILRDVTRVLQEEQGGGAYELNLDEFRGLVEARVAEAARRAGVSFTMTGEASGVLTNRQANLLLLILENLLANAFEASPARGRVGLEVARRPEGIQFTVRDEGSGIPEELRAALFTPRRSTKPNGTGIGLAISQQLAHHLGARLELAESTPQGTSFTLTMPL